MFHLRRRLCVDLITAILITSCILLIIIEEGSCANVVLSNLDERCFRCLCYGATSCNLTLGCRKGYCGPFHVARIYWAEADKHVFEEDDPERDQAWMDCANDYGCSKGMLAKYMQKHGRDCDGDGVTNCDDYSILHYNGGYNCKSIAESNFGRRYASCKDGQVEGFERLNL